MIKDELEARLFDTISLVLNVTIKNENELRITNKQIDSTSFILLEISALN